MEVEGYEHFLFVGGPANGQKIAVMDDRQEVFISSESFLGGTATEIPAREAYRRLEHFADPSSPKAFYAWIGISADEAIKQYQAKATD